MADILVAKTNAVFDYEGRRVVIRAGVTRVRAGHPITEGREDLFEPITVDYDVEQATAAPGEKRSVRRSKPKPEDTGG